MDSLSDGTIWKTICVIGLFVQKADSTCNKEQHHACRTAAAGDNLQLLDGGGSCEPKPYIKYTHVCSVNNYVPNVDYCCCQLDHLVLCCRYHQDWNHFRCAEPEDTIDIAVPEQLFNGNLLLAAILAPIVLVGVCLFCFLKCCCYRYVGDRQVWIWEFSKKTKKDAMSSKIKPRPADTFSDDETMTGDNPNFERSSLSSVFVRRQYTHRHTNPPATTLTQYSPIPSQCIWTKPSAGGCNEWHAMRAYDRATGNHEPEMTTHHQLPPPPDILGGFQKNCYDYMPLYRNFDNSSNGGFPNQFPGGFQKLFFAPQNQDASATTKNLSTSCIACHSDRLGSCANCYNNCLPVLYCGAHGRFTELPVATSVDCLFPIATPSSERSLPPTAPPERLSPISENPLLKMAPAESSRQNTTSSSDKHADETISNDVSDDIITSL